ncbi:MAG: glycosyltransferase family 39 protein [Candidatus Eisenbacteria bacterium]
MLDETTDKGRLPAPGSRTERLFVLGLLLVALALRLYRLSGQSIWVDEMLTLSSSGITAPLHAVDVFENLHGPLQSLLLFLWSKVAGHGEFALRLPSVAFSVLSLAAIYRLVLRLAGFRTAATALAVLVLSPFHVWYAQEIRNYSMLLFFSALSLDSYLSLLSSPNRGVFGRYVLFTLAAFLCNMSTAFLLIVQDLLFLFLPRRLSFRKLLLANLLLMLLLAPWLSQIVQKIELHRLVRTDAYPASQSLRGVTTFTPFALPYTFFVFSVGYSLGPSLRDLHESVRLSDMTRHLPLVLPAAIGFSAAFVAGVLSLRRDRRLLAFLLLWMAVPLAIISFFGIKNFKPFNPRYVMIAMPAYVLLVAHGLSRLRGVTLRVLVGALIFGTMSISLWNHFHAPRYGKEDFRAAAAVLAPACGEGSVVFTEGTYEPLVYYLKGQARLVPLYRETVTDDVQLEALVRRESAGASAVCLVISRHWEVDPDGKVIALFRRLFEPGSVHRLEGVEIALFRRAGVP